jgi:N-acetylglucosamine kinase-like BadF-type ATPase
MADMKDCIIALDIGGTKAHLVIETVDGTRILDTQIPSQDWDAEPLEQGAAWVAAKLAANIPADVTIASLAFGAQGINSADIGQGLTAELAKLGYPATVVNDAALIVAAAGLDDGIGIIAGTGAIGVSKDKSGAHIAAGGWGSVIGDEGGAAALVREAARAALRALDEGKPDDGLLSALIADFGVADAERLTRKVNDEPTAENWAPHCPAIFAAADAGSLLAQQVIVEGATCLAALVGQLLARGATGTDIVVAGSVIVNQPRLFDAFVEAVQRRHPLFSVHKLLIGPVEGAVFLARKMRAKTA